MKSYRTLNNELQSAGIDNKAIGRTDLEPCEVLVNTKISAKPFREILISYLSILKGNELEMVIRALSEKGMKDVSWRLVSILKNEKEFPDLDLWTVGNAISIIDDNDCYSQVLEICKSKKLGSSRQMMMTTLRRIKTTESFELLLSCLKDESVRGHAINELSKWGDKKALKPILNTKVRKGLFEEKARKKAIVKLSKKANTR